MPVTTHTVQSHQSSVTLLMRPFGGPTRSGHNGSRAAFPTSTKFLRAAVRAVVPATVVAMASSEAAAARGVGGKYPPKVQAVLEYLREHPMSVTSTAMQYDAAPTTPLPDCIQGLTPADVLSPGSDSSSSSSRSSHMACVIAGLLYAACGGLDQAHNLVTPLCWGSWTPYAGQPVANSPAAAEAAYVHAIVHRQEGRCIGEFGSGFRNANYWYRAAGDHPISQDVFKAAKKLAVGVPACEAHIAKHGDSWQPSKFLALCDQMAGGSQDKQLSGFCEGVMAAELDLLLRWCYTHL